MISRKTEMDWIFFLDFFFFIISFLIASFLVVKFSKPDDSGYDEDAVPVSREKDSVSPGY